MNMPRYAKQTTVPVSRSKAQVEETLRRYGIDEFFIGSSPRGDGVGFTYNGRVYKHNVPMPNPDDYRTDRQHDQAIRQRWRILHMSLKMKLEEVQSGGMTFEDQFLSMMCLPDGSTVADFMRLPANAKLLDKAEMPLLTGGQQKE